MTKQPHVTRLKTDPGYDRDEYETPPELFNKLDKIFKFDLDVASNYMNSLCSESFIKDSSDGDALDDDLWDCGRHLSIFCNPPFSNKEEFLKRGVASRNYNTVIVFLLPNNARSTDYWCTYVLQADLIINLTPRVQYLIKGERPQRFDKKTQKWIDSGVAFDSCVVVYYPRIKEINYGLPKEVYWQWKESTRCGTQNKT